MSLPDSVDIERVPRDVHTTGSDDESRTRTQQSSSPSLIKRPRILSTIGSSISAHDGQSSNIAERHEDAESKSNAHDKPEMMQRNRRLFGALMGHLGTAKRKLEEDSSTIDKQTSRQNAVAHKNGMENKRLQQLDRKAADAGKSKVAHCDLRRVPCPFSSMGPCSVFVANRIHKIERKSIFQYDTAFSMILLLA